MRHPILAPLATAGALLLPAAAAPAASPETRLIATAGPGATPALNGTLPIGATTVANGRLRIAFTNGAEQWTLVLAGPDGTTPAVGTYADAQPLGAPVAGKPSIGLTGPRACTPAAGASFAITDLRTAATTVERLHATFTLTCTGDADAQTGEARVLRRHPPKPVAVARSPKRQERVVGLEGRTLVWTEAPVGTPDVTTVYRRIADGAAVRLRIPTSGYARSFSGRTIVGSMPGAGGTYAGAAWSISGSRLPLPRGFQKDESNLVAATDGRYWLYTRLRKKPYRAEVHLLDATTRRDAVLARSNQGWLVDDVRHGKVAWGICDAATLSTCDLRLRTAAGGRVTVARPPHGRSYYSASIGPAGDVVSVDGSAAHCGLRTRLVRVLPSGQVQPLVSLPASTDSGHSSVTRSGTLERIVYTTYDCRNDRTVDSDVWQVDVDPAVLPPLA